MDSLIDFTKFGLTKKQVNYLLYVIQSEESIKDCAAHFNIVEDSLHRLLSRVDRKFPGFRARLKKMRQVTLNDGHNSMPREIPWGDMSDLEDLKYGKDEVE